MRHFTRSIGIAASALLLLSTGACSAASGLGSVLGSVLGQGQGQGSQVSGTFQGLDTRNAQLALTQSNGQTIYLAYDNNTQVTYNNQRYQVTNLERGDQVTARVQQLQNGGYYTDLIQVDRSVSSSTSTSGTSVQSYQGTVRAINQSQGWFSIDAGNGYTYDVVLANQLTRDDYSRFNALRTGDYVRFYGVMVANNRVELRQFN